MEKKSDLRIEKTYLFLHNAFTELLEEKRFEDVTVNELCQRAMIRRATFYKHFADKYEYFAFYAREISADFQSQLPPDMIGNNLNTYFMHMCREMLRFIDAHESLVRNFLNSSMFSVLLDSLCENMMCDILNVLQRMENTKHLTRQEMEGIASFYSGGLIHIFRLWLKRGLPVDETSFLAVIANVLE